MRKLFKHNPTKISGAHPKGLIKRTAKFYLN